MVPAALGSNPLVAQDYPLYPVQTLNSHQHQHEQQYMTGNGHKNSATALLAVKGEGAAVGPRSAAAGMVTNPPLPSQLEVAGAGGRVALIPVALAPIPSQEDQHPLHQHQHQQQIPYGVPSPLKHQLMPLQHHSVLTPSSGGSGGGSGSNSDGMFKTYANASFVRSSGGGGGGGGVPEAAMLREYVSAGHPSLARHGSVTGLAAAPTSGPQGYSSGHTSVDSPFFASHRNMPYGGSGGGGGGGIGGDSGAVMSGHALRRPGLPPLATYTSVTNSSAPVVALSSSLRTIPVNATFNSSLRPPQPPMQPTRALSSQPPSPHSSARSERP